MNLRNLFSFKSVLCWLALIGFFCLSPEQLFPETAPRSTTSISPGSDNMTPTQNTVKAISVEAAKQEFDNFKRPSLITQGVVLSLFSLLPFIVMILTSFLKIVIVLSLLRSALGVQQAPPNQIINGVAFMLSLFIMYPTGIKIYEAANKTINETKAPDSLISEGSSTYIIAIAQDAAIPARDFLKRNSSVTHQALFYRMAYRVLPENFRPTLKPDDIIVLVPSYITSQLKDAFEIGVLIYIPFFVIDLVTSNILLAMGMMMLSPVTISMPLKLFLLVMLDGWTLLIQGLVATFR
ncbi:MAG TPA: type III secretion system export apparatus subunit SctR [Parachlamydiaceae bacterium]|nr:type III secretion system export apparatus subunit SctR [Parachlamydiaceae bacterium]